MRILMSTQDVIAVPANPQAGPGTSPSSIALRTAVSADPATFRPHIAFPP